MEEQLKHFYRELKGGESISHIYYLGNVVKVDTKDGNLPKGAYILHVNYDNNLSNEISFVIK